MLIIDRFEGNIAVIENGDETFDVPLSELPEGVREGDVLVCDGGIYRMDAEETARRKERVKSMFEKLKKKRP